MNPNDSKNDTGIVNEMNNEKPTIDVVDQTKDAASVPVPPKTVDLDKNRIVIANGYLLVEGAKGDYCLDGKSIVLVRVERAKKLWKVTFTPPARDHMKKPVKEILTGGRDEANKLIGAIHDGLHLAGIQTRVMQLEDSPSN